MSNNKKFKDTKIGKFLKNKAPKILDIVGDVLPDQGALSIVKNLIDKDDNISAEDKKALHNQLIESYKTEVADRDSARKREVEIAKVRKFDFMFTLTGLVGLSTFVFLVYAIVYINIPEHNEKTFYTLIGLVEGITLSIFSFYFGASIRKN
jgi:hypothetical protein|tara:strand:+ start:6502 stop:6954 length:453 start_codon:yes stop_codon:yes gene_type:complete